jgi:hypothetical protein
VLGILLGGVLTMGGLYAYQHYNKRLALHDPIESPTLVSTENTEQIASSTPTEFKGKLYKNTTYGYTLVIPNGWDNIKIEEDAGNPTFSFRNQYGEYVPVLEIGAYDKDAWIFNQSAESSYNATYITENQNYRFGYGALITEVNSEIDHAPAILFDIKNKIIPSFKLTSYTNDIVTLSEYSDTTFGVRFKYNASWKQTEDPSMYNELHYMKEVKKDGIVYGNLNPWIQIRKDVPFPPHTASEISIINGLTTMRKTEIKEGIYFVYYYVTDGKTPYSIMLHMNATTDPKDKIAYMQDQQTIIATLQIIYP